MNLQELLKSVEWDLLWDRMLIEYEDQHELKDNYFRTYNRCIMGEPVATSMRIILERVFPDEEDLEIDPDAKSYVDVSGSNGTLYKDDEDFREGNSPYNQDLADTEVVYGIEFSPWNEWIAMEIDSKTLTEFTPVEIAVHCLWEMTFLSFDEVEIGDQLDNLVDKCNQIDSDGIDIILLDDFILGSNESEDDS